MGLTLLQRRTLNVCLPPTAYMNLEQSKCTCVWKYFDTISICCWAAAHHSCSHLPLQSPQSVCLLWEKPVLAHPPGSAVNTFLLPVWWCWTELWIHITHSLWLCPRLRLREVFTICEGNWNCSLLWQHSDTNNVMISRYHFPTCRTWLTRRWQWAQTYSWEEVVITVRYNKSAAPVGRGHNEKSTENGCRLTGLW